MPSQPSDVLTWRPGRSASEQSAVMDEHTDCTTCRDEFYVVTAWHDHAAVWGPCPACNNGGAKPRPTWSEWAAAHGLRS